ncbi:MAG: T9SS type A sorting domain-containing protein [Bacteroidota bacterium]|nr:T9SS type A sorting domain-containing protein [Bacteroidota bacterium]MDP4249458.1 T9SS type A sorting domain-containing protein [Bacteroidota bacterium]
MKTCTRSMITSRILSILMLPAFCAYSAQAQIPNFDFGKSYVNVTKGVTGGTIEPGDVLEIRATFVVGGTGFADSCGYFDVIPANTSYVTGSLAVLTNEGKIYKSFTDATGDDAGYVSGSNVRINLGFKTAPRATAFVRGRVSYNDKPSFYGSTCIMIASYRVTVTGAYGNTVSLGGGSITYRPNASTTIGVLTNTFAMDNVMIFKNLGICTNTSGTNSILSEFGGTFGSGKAKNRTPSAKVDNSGNYIYNLFGPNSPQDYYYNISNNTSTGGVGYTTLNTWPIPDVNIPPTTQTHRVFGIWDIIGDHTGATNPLLGNPAADTVNSTGGYMAVINSSYRTGIAFMDTINNLCPNTYYQYYAWFRNICSRCACDSNGNSPDKTGYKPTGPGDSSGVHPNLTFNVNGYDYYTTGDLLYTGQWIRKGFTYLTGPTQTSMIIYIRNNAPGGGGNDWAIDDIGVATCTPNISLTPDKPDTLCQGSDDTVRFKVSAFFNNYTEWRLEKSVDGGVTWTSPGLDTLGNAASGSSIPVYNPVTSLYEYLVTRYYRLNNVDPIVIYRLILASTTGSLNDPNCRYITSSPKYVYTVNCLIVLPTVVTLKGNVSNGFAQLQWISSQETENIVYSVERSDDQGMHYSTIGTVPGKAFGGNGAVYQFQDPQSMVGQVLYRIRINDQQFQAYSKVILLSNRDIPLEISGLLNPFSSSISFNMTAPEDHDMTISLYDAYGRLLTKTSHAAYKGLNHYDLSSLSNLQSGMYVLQVLYKDQMITKQLIKKVE